MQVPRAWDSCCLYSEFSVLDLHKRLLFSTSQMGFFQLPQVPRRKVNTEMLRICSLFSLILVMGGEEEDMHHFPRITCLVSQKFCLNWLHLLLGNLNQRKGLSRPTLFSTLFPLCWYSTMRETTDSCITALNILDPIPSLTGGCHSVAKSSVRLLRPHGSASRASLNLHYLWACSNSCPWSQRYYPTISSL